MVKRMLIDAAHEEEMRVAVIDGNRLEDFDFESKIKKQIKGNIYLAKVTRVEPSLQACFVEYGGNRQGFLAFSEIHPDYYRIPVEDRMALLEEERRIAELEEQEAAIEDDRAVQSMGNTSGDFPEHSNNEEFHDDGENGSDKVEELKSDSENSDENGLDEPKNDIMFAENETEDDKISEPVEVSGTSSSDDAPVVQEAEIFVKKSRGRTPRKSQEGNVVAVVPTDVSDTGENENIADEIGSDENSSEHNGQENRNRNRERGDRDDNNGRRRVSSLRKRYKIQEVITRRQIMLVQVTKEERGNKGAALTSYISLPGRYCVLMPNSPRGGGISRKISNPKDRRHMREIIKDMNVPEGMSVILRTAGLQRNRTEIKRDLDYLLRLWDSIRQLTLESIAPTLIYEEGDLAKRAIRDLYGNDVDEVLVNDDEAYKAVKEFMKMLMPSHAKKVKLYKGEALPLFHRYQVENQIDEIYKPEVRLKSGGYIVINPTEALVSIDVNSGKSTRERNIDETALKTNLEAADEIARQLRLRDLGGLVVVDFIDMESSRHNMKVERKMRDSMAGDRARVEVGRMSQFGLLELSRQRLRPSFSETHFEKCEHCAGIGLVRTVESAAVVVLREIEEEGIRNRAESISISVPSNVALYLLNQKRAMLTDVESRYKIHIFVRADENMSRNDYRVEPMKIREKGSEKDVSHALTMGNFETPENVTANSEKTSDYNDDIDDVSDNDNTDTGTEGNSESGAGNSEHRSGGNDTREDRFQRRRGGRNRFRSGGFRDNRRDEPREDGEQTNSSQRANNDENVVSDDSVRPGNENGRNSENDRDGENRRNNGRRRFDRNRRGSDRNQRDNNRASDNNNNNAEVSRSESSPVVRPSVSVETVPVVQHKPVQHPQNESVKPEVRHAPPAPRIEKTLVVGSDAGVETVNLKPESPKRGWWKKLVE